jgi:hypothetical protein
MNRRQFLGLAAAVVLAAGVSVSAHHSWPVDNSRSITVRGTVTGYEWNNPHVMIGLDVRTDAGRVEKWSVGGPSTSRMANNGWDRATLKPGDVITATGYRFSDGQNILRLEKIIMASGREMFLYGRR